MERMARHPRLLMAPATSGRLLLSGNDAVARGAWEAGVTVASSYPGTPATEILESLARYPGVYAEWAPNEKVAFEVGMGASLGGARALVAMKHVGLNVAADPLMTGAYVGVGGGFVVIVADDVGMASSQNAQDTRYLARFAKVPLLEPSDSQEAMASVAHGLRLSEEFDTPVIVRLTTRISHVQGVVELGERQEAPFRGFRRDPGKLVVLPANARRQRPRILDRLRALALHAATSPLNPVEWRDRAVGIVASGPAYMYAREAFPDASILKLGLSFPLAETLVRDFAAGVDRLFVVEELEGIVEAEIQALGLTVHSAGRLPRVGELTPQRIRGALDGGGGAPEAPEPEAEPFPRPPTLCAGCPHMGVFTVLARMRDVVVAGDIGCYTLGAGAPWKSLDTCVCMGASIGNALGIAHAYRMAGQAQRVLAVIGDSTFLHSGMTGLLDAVYNRAKLTLLILDNGTTGMTGGQDHPGTGVTLQRVEGPALDLAAVCRALGIAHVRRVDPYSLDEVSTAIREALAHDGPSVVITGRPCVLVEAFQRPQAFAVQDSECNGCGACLRTGCPAIQVARHEAVPLSGGRVRHLRYVRIDPAACNGCGICAEVCAQAAIVRLGADTVPGGVEA
jgi:indolepyruvate ferredoxin oxidoreductase alpha subunit